MALTKTDTAESLFNAFGWPNREARSDVDPSEGWGLLDKRALIFVLTLLSALLVGCGGDGDSGADTAGPQAVPLQEQVLVFTQAGPLNLVVGDTLSNVASGGLGTGVIRYSSSDTTVATVDATGRLTVVGAGIAMIAAEKAADAQYAAARAGYVVSATPAPQDPGLEPQRIGFDQPGPFNLVVGDTLSNVASGGLGTGVIRYSSSDTTVATVDATGRLTVVGAGIAMIAAEKAADAQYAAARAGYVVSATPAPQDPGPEPQRIGFDQPGPFNLVVGDTLRNVASGGSGTGVIRYSSSDTTVATVDATGRLTVVGAGIAMITAEKAADAQYAAASASYLVQTTQASQAITFDQPGPFHLMVGDTLSNEASGGSGTGVISYSSSNTTVATVDAAGQLTVVGIGTAEITAEKAADAQYTAASASYTVTAPSRVPMTAWVGSKDAEVNLPSSATGMSFFRSTEANCDLSNVENCANGQRDIVFGGQTVEDTAFTLDQTAYYVLQHGANQASLEVSTEERSTNANNADFSPREGHQVVVHNNRLWVIGGFEGPAGLGVVKNDVWWSEDGVTWTEVARTGRRFSTREGHQVVAYNNRLWVIGGNDRSVGLKNDVWRSEDGVTWEEVLPNNPNPTPADPRFSGRSEHQVAVYDDKLWVIGGWEGGNVRKNDVWWSKDGATWTEVAPTGRRFSERSEHQVAVHNNRLWVIGGSGGIAFVGNDIFVVTNKDVWWSEDGATWEEVEQEPNSDKFSPRRDHQVVAHNNWLWVIGGRVGSSVKNDVWRSEDGADWTKVTNSADFSPRGAHRVVAHNNRLWMIGGWDGAARKNDVWRSEDGENWRLGFHHVFEFQ